MRISFPKGPSLAVASLIAIGLLGSASTMAGDPVYKWKDAGGQSHYSQQPPDKGTKFEIVQTAGPSTSTLGGPAAASQQSAGANGSNSGTAPAGSSSTTASQSQPQDNIPQK